MSKEAGGNCSCDPPKAVLPSTGLFPFDFISSQKSAEKNSLFGLFVSEKILQDFKKCACIYLRNYTK